MRLLDDASLAATTFFGRNQTDEKYGANGLPLTPVSIRIIGKFQRLKSLYHPHLATYLDISRGKYDEVYVVSEYHQRNLRNWQSSMEFSPVLSLAFQILSALDYLHEKHNIVHRCLHPTNILLTSKGQVRLAQYGLYHMTNNGADVAFPIGYPEYLAPEVLAVGPHRHKSHLSGAKSDIWSVGVILLELLLPGRKLFRKASVSEVICQILSLSGFVGSALQCLVAEEELLSLQNRNPELLIVVEQCLIPDATKRPSARQLLGLDCFSHLRCELETPVDGLDTLFSSINRCSRLDLKSLQTIIDDKSREAIINPMSFRAIQEFFHLWRLSGPDVETILQKKGLVKIQPPVWSIPNVIIDECEYFGMEETRETAADLSLVPLSTENLKERLRAIDPLVYYPCLEIKYANCGSEGNGSDVIRESDVLAASGLPIVIKEEDIEYQLQRQVLFDRLLKAYPFKRSLIWKESRLDIPPLYRRYVWAALLDINANDVAVYEKIDKITPTSTDRQIEVDVPRCHQYDELLSSHEGHKKFKRILKSWVNSHPQYVYWQGLDSLCAPFIHLNFNDEALAYACLSAFIPKYLYNFFLKDNSAIIHEYLAVFSHLIAFHDPELFVHLNVIAFVPELYAIPWFLTMFAHVFPLRKTFHLWDTLLLGNASLPLFVGVAILMQLRTQLLSNGFNECILLFSDLPEIDIQRCVEDSIRLFCATPRSATYRTNAPPPPTLRPRTPNSSFIGYSLDSPDLGMTPYPLAELKSEICPRMCADELMQLAGLHNNKGNNSHTQSKLLILDIRPKEDFLKGTFPGSVNIPFASAFKDSGEFQLPTNKPAVQQLYSSKGHLIAVVGSKACSSALFAGELVRLGFPKICLLHNDIHIFSHCRNEVLTIPPYQL